MQQRATWLVVGATSAIAQRLVRGALASQTPPRFVLLARNRDRLAAFADELRAPAGDVVQVVADDSAAVRDGDIAAACKASVDTFGRLDGAVNLIGSVLLKPAHATSEAELWHTMHTNLGTAFSLVRHAARAMSSGGSIVLCGSAVASMGVPNHEAIAAAKAAVVGLARSAASTYAKNNVRVNVVAPGLTDTPLTARIVSNEAARKFSLTLQALQRVGAPDDVADAIAFLLRSAHCTGQVLHVDGGLASAR